MEKKRTFLIGMPPEIYRRAREEGAHLDANRRCFFYGDVPEEFKRYIMRPSLPPVERSIATIAAAHPTEPAAFDPELVEILAGITEPEQRSAVIADFYKAKIARLLARPGSLNNSLGGREWIGKIQARESSGDPTLSAYAIQLAREATR
jgi:hypothetical protein